MFYRLIVNLYRSSDIFETVIDTCEEFRNKNLIEAREECFRKYQSYIDVLLESLDKAYINHKNTVENFNSFLYSEKETLECSPFYDSSGISISLIYNDEVSEETEFYVNGKKHIFKNYVGEITIHGIESTGIGSTIHKYLNSNQAKNIYINNLKLEKDIYDKNNFEIRNLNKEFNFLKTPIDFQQKNCL